MNSSTNSTGMDPGMLAAMLAAMAEGASAEQTVWTWTCVGLSILATVAVGLRVLARMRTIATLGWDDAFICASLLPLWGLVAVGIIMAKYGGMGLLAMSLSPDQSYVFYRTLFSSMILYALCITLIKISILLLYKRVFDTRRFRITVYVVGTLCLFWFVTVILVTLFQCQPVEYAWDRTNQGQCINLRAMYFGVTISNMLLDLTINFMPFHLVWKLRVSKKRRVCFISILLLGIIADVAAAGRIYSVPNLIITDVSATIMMPLLYTVIEPAFAILCACLVTYRPLAKALSPNSLKRYFRSTQNRFRTSTAENPLNATTATTDLTNPFGSSASDPANPFASCHTDVEQAYGSDKDLTGEIELKVMESQSSFAARVGQETGGAVDAGVHGVSETGTRRGGGPGLFGRGRGGADKGMGV
ncbi:hypothetical protein MMC30_000543 [Trapelia coarctata]|nr:hypothetical protein [Trapelia coarctata]